MSSTPLRYPARHSDTMRDMPTSPPPASAAGRITAEQLAEQLGFSRPGIYRLLAKGLVPGVFVIDPQASRPRYYIPADAAQRFLAQGAAR
jgi:predicted DNA-binding transcriptional regulator AlpA